MRLSFHARGDALVTVPGHTPRIGQQLRRVGRLPSASAGSPVPPASDVPFSCDSESPAGVRLSKLLRREPCLWPADAETAAACGVPFVKIVLRDGAWVPSDTDTDTDTDTENAAELAPSAGADRNV